MHDEVVVGAEGVDEAVEEHLSDGVVQLQVLQGRLHPPPPGPLVVAQHAYGCEGVKLVLGFYLLLFI